MKKKSFFRAVMDNSPWQNATITVMTVAFGWYSFYFGVAIMGWFMVLVFSVLWGMEYSKWKKS